MGSRAVVVACRDQEAAVKRFGASGDELGVIYTRTGRPFFKDQSLETMLLKRIVAALDGCDFWDRLQTSWVCLDCELMPWSAKAKELLRTQYAAVGAAGRASIPRTLGRLEQALDRLPGAEHETLLRLKEKFNASAGNIARFTAAYRQYCWEVGSIEDYKLAPFHVLATEDCVHVDKAHAWHMQEIEKICAQDNGVLKLTKTMNINLNDEGSRDAGVQWWLEMTQRGGEGMVVKPDAFVKHGKKGLVQPAVKCRGPEYLRIIYGPDYDHADNLVRLRNRFLGRKRSLALREFALGIESLQRFVDRKPLRKIHECAFGVLALESEPVDPRL